MLLKNFTKQIQHSMDYMVLRVAQQLRCWTYDQKVASSTPGRVTIKWLLLGWAAV